MEFRKKLEKEFLPFVSRPARYIGSEYNSVTKDPSQPQLKVAIIFPDVYEVGMAHPEMLMYYHFLNNFEGIWAQRVFAPDEEAEEVLRTNGLPAFSWESKSNLNDFHLLWIILPDAGHILELLTILSLSSLPFYARERSNTWPFLLAVAPAELNPETISPFVDAFLFHRAETNIDAVVQRFMKGYAESWDKVDLLTQLQALPSVYVPQFYTAKYNSFGEFDGMERRKPHSPAAEKEIPAERPGEMAVHYKPLFPLMESSAWVAADDFRHTGNAGPFRLTAALCESICPHPFSVALRQQALSAASLPAPDKAQAALNNFPMEFVYWNELRKEQFVSDARARIELPSLRVSPGLRKMETVLSELRKKEFRIGPIAASSRFRVLLPGNLRLRQIESLLRELPRKGWKTVVIQVILGLPFETADDRAELAQFFVRCGEILQAHDNRKLIGVLVPFSPKAFTPFQWEKLMPEKEFEKSVEQIRAATGGDYVEWTVISHSLAQVRTAISRGDRRMAEIIVAAWRRGARFLSRPQNFRPQPWTEAFAESHLTLAHYTEAFSITRRLPWEHIGSGISIDRLKKLRLEIATGRAPDWEAVGVSRFAPLPTANFSEWVEQILGAAGEAAGNPEGPAKAAEGEMVFGRRSRKRPAAMAPIKRKIRLRFAKVGSARFLSHPDFVRLFEVVARKASIPLIYTQGLNPHPKISFAPPAGVGVASTAEYMDIEVAVGKETDIGDRLNRVLPEGIQVLQYQPIFNKAPALAAVINRITYEVLLEQEQLEESAVAEWLAQSEIWQERVVKNETRPINVRPFVLRMELSENKILITIGKSDDRFIKIWEVLDSLFSPNGIDSRRLLVQRTGQYIEKENYLYTPFDIIQNQAPLF